MKFVAAALLALAAPLAPAAADPAPPAETMHGTRLAINATGEVARAPDLARVSAGIVTMASTAKAAMADNEGKMASVRAALRRAGIEERDIQTSELSLEPQYREETGSAPRLTGYRASDQVSVRFRDIASAGAIVDALVAEGANQISGPSLEISRPEAALDEARTAALATARARAELYARAAGLRVVRIVSISEGDGAQPMPMMRARGFAGTVISAGEQTLAVTLSVVFELQ